jgi:outer membrane protein OmpA-like peptidoglycan-associated protein
VYTYSVGEAKTLAEMYEVYRKVKELRFLDAEVMAIEPEKLTDMSALASLSLEELNNTTVRTSTVNFDFDKASFKKGSEAALDQVKALLYEHSDLDVVIEAHTDSKGKADYNMKLSQRRAQAIVDWLTSHGVEAARMTAVGFGEDHPVASNEHEIGRGQNRRVEFRMVMRGDQANARRR